MASSRCKNVEQLVGCEADSLACRNKIVAGGSQSCLDTGTAAIHLAGDAEEACPEDRSDFHEADQLRISHNLGIRLRLWQFGCGNSPPRRRRSAHILEIHAIVFGGQFNWYVPMNTAETASWQKRE